MKWWYILIPLPMTLFIGVAAATASKSADDPGPKVQYGGTPIELHFDAPGANVTKAHVDGTECIIVSFAEAPDSGIVNSPTLALSCDWGPK